MDQRRKFPERVPVQISPSASGEKVKLKKSRFLVGKNDAFGILAAAVRRNCADIHPEEALFYYVLPHGDKNHATIPSVSMTMGDIDREFGSDKDGILQMYVCKENTFGYESDEEHAIVPAKVESTPPIMKPIIEIRNITIHKNIPKGIYYYVSAAIYECEIQYSINSQSSICKEEIDMNESSSLLFRIYEIIRKREKIQGLAEWRFSPVTF